MSTGITPAQWTPEKDYQLRQHILDWIGNDAIAAAIRDSLGNIQDIDHTIDLLLSNEDLINALKNQKGSTTKEEFEIIKNRMLAIPSFLFDHRHKALKDQIGISWTDKEMRDNRHHHNMTNTFILRSSKYIGTYSTDYYLQYSMHDLDRYIQRIHSAHRKGWGYAPGEVTHVHYWIKEKTERSKKHSPSNKRFWKSYQRAGPSRLEEYHYHVNYYNTVTRAMDSVWDSDFVDKVRQGPHGHRHDTPIDDGSLEKGDINNAQIDISVDDKVDITDDSGGKDNFTNSPDNEELTFVSYVENTLASISTPDDDTPLTAEERRFHSLLGIDITLLLEARKLRTILQMKDWTETEALQYIFVTGYYMVSGIPARFRAHFSEVEEDDDSIVSYFSDDNNDILDNDRVTFDDTEKSIELNNNDEGEIIECVPTAAEEIMDKTGDTDQVFLYKMNRGSNKKIRRSLSSHLTGTSRDYHGAIQIANPHVIIIQKYIRRFLSTVKVKMKRGKSLPIPCHKPHAFTPRIHHQVAATTDWNFGALTVMLIIKRSHGHVICTLPYHVVHDWRWIDLLVRKFGHCNDLMASTSSARHYTIRGLFRYSTEDGEIVDDVVNLSELSVDDVSLLEMDEEWGALAAKLSVLQGTMMKSGERSGIFVTPLQGTMNNNGEQLRDTDTSHRINVIAVGIGFDVIMNDRYSQDCIHPIATQGTTTTNNEEDNTCNCNTGLERITNYAPDYGEQVRYHRNIINTVNCENDRLHQLTSYAILTRGTSDTQAGDDDHIVHGSNYDSVKINDTLGVNASEYKEKSETTTQYPHHTNRINELTIGNTTGYRLLEITIDNITAVGKLPRLTDGEVSDNNNDLHCLRPNNGCDTSSHIALTAGTLHKYVVMTISGNHLIGVLSDEIFGIDITGIMYNEALDSYDGNRVMNAYIVLIDGENNACNTFHPNCMNPIIHGSLRVVQSAAKSIGNITTINIDTDDKLSKLVNEDVSSSNHDYVANGTLCLIATSMLVIGDKNFGEHHVTDTMTTSTSNAEMNCQLVHSNAECSTPSNIAPTSTVYTSNTNVILPHVNAHQWNDTYVHRLRTLIDSVGNHIGSIVPLDTSLAENYVGKYCNINNLTTDSTNIIDMIDIASGLTDGLDMNNKTGRLLIEDKTMHIEDESIWQGGYDCEIKSVCDYAQSNQFGSMDTTLLWNIHGEIRRRTNGLSTINDTMIELCFNDGNRLNYWMTKANRRGVTDSGNSRSQSATVRIWFVSFCALIW